MRISGLSKLLLFVALVVVPILTQQGSARQIFKFAKKEPRIIVGHYNQMVQIDCTTTDPTATTALYHKRSNKKSDLKRPVTHALRNGSVFTVRNLGSEHTGFYCCEATGPGGAKIEWNKRSGRLFVIGLPDRYRTKKLNVGGGVIIKCSGPKGTVFRWHNKPSSGVRETSATRRGWSKSILRLTNVQQRYNHRTITCLATYRRVTRRHNYKLIVNNPIPCKPHLERFVRTIFNPKPKQKVEMTCKVKRCMYPPPTFTWEMQWWPCSISNFDPECIPRSGKWDKSVMGRIKTSGTKSTLSVYDYMQIGLFRCTARNFMGEDSIIYRLIGRQQPIKQHN